MKVAKEYDWFLLMDPTNHILLLLNRLERSSFWIILDASNVNAADILGKDDFSVTPVITTN